MTIDPKTRAESLPCWRGPVEAEPLPGGMTNINFVVRDGGERFVVRIGDDIPVHQVMRFNERAASLAAHAAGLSPEVIHAEPGALVMRLRPAPLQLRDFSLVLWHIDYDCLAGWSRAAFGLG